MALAPSSEGQRPMVAVEEGLRPVPEKISRLIDYEFSKAGLTLSGVLWRILNLACETKFDAASATPRLDVIGDDDQQPLWLSKLYEWRELVGSTAVTLIETINQKVGYEIDYCNTKSFSIYVWWRICKMVSDIEVVASSSTVNIDDLVEYFDYTRQLSLELWLGFVITLERDTRIFRLTKGGHIVPESSGTFRTVQDPDMFPDIEPGRHSKLEEYLTDSIDDLLYDTTPASASLALKTRAEKIYWKLRLFFKQSPISCEDFVLTATILSAHATLGAESVKADLSRRSYELPRSFKKWRDTVRDAVDTPEIDRLVTRIYQMLIGRPGSPTIRILCHSLWDLLATTPKLFRAFEPLVPDCCLAVWHSESQGMRKSTPRKSPPLSLPYRVEQSQSRDSVHLRGGDSADEDDSPQPTINIGTINITNSPVNVRIG